MRDGSLLDDGDLLLTAREGAAHDVRLAVREDAWCDADDLCILCGEAQQLGAAAADEKRRMRTLDRTGEVLEALDPVEAAIEGNWAVGEEALHDGHRFGQPVDSHCAGIVGDARPPVLRLVPAGPHARLQAPR